MAGEIQESEPSQLFVHPLLCIGGSSVADPDPAFHFDADPDPAFLFDSDPSFQIKAQNLEKVLK
jgi:hypothetical protein